MPERWLIEQREHVSYKSGSASNFTLSVTEKRQYNQEAMKRFTDCGETPTLQALNLARRDWFANSV
jgi:hypothetical protein